MTRTCERDGCAGSLEGMRAHARFCGPGCRRAAHREESVPKRAHVARRACSGPSGLQVSYRKAVGVLERVVANGPILVWGDGRRRTPQEAAELLMAEALSPTQRARLEARP